MIRQAPVSHPRARGSPTPTLFLDFDGVLHPNLASPAEHFSRVPLLLEAIGDAALDVVISSSWRFQWSLTRMRSFFPEGFQSRIVATTGAACVGRHARWREITAFCEAASIGDWRALDDARFEFPDPCAQLIWCEGGQGVQQKQAEALRCWLSATRG